ncbi:MAG TPA: SDR family oxidoreductase [Acidimicrobiales bacterium]|nr:MAG: 3-beta hydroxysteroid dehydrogenase [Actinobacteria bacterium 21-73-9]HQU26093.1 SDR family oxidoreductase [Acidimicrobiales bacterium]
MRIFVTGATGHIGSRVVDELLGAGHEVTGLAHHDAAAAALAARGVGVVRGGLEDPEGLARAARASEGVIHLAYRHDFSRMEENAALDNVAVRAMGEALVSSGGALVIASGTLVLAAAAPGRVGTEDDAASGDVAGRARTENDAVALGARGVRTVVVRLPPTVHSPFDAHGFVPTLVRLARERGSSAFVGDGATRWPAVHTLDAARLFRLAVESAPPGTRLHAVADEGVAFREIARAVGRGLGVPAVSVRPDEAAEHLGFLGALAQVDNPTSSARTRDLLDWRPEHPRLLPDLDAGHYFA